MEHKPKVTMDYGGRGGEIWLEDGNHQLRFPWEMSADGFDIFVPSPENWQLQTGLPLEHRMETLEWIAQCAIAQRAKPESTFNIVDEAFSWIAVHF